MYKLVKVISCRKADCNKNNKQIIPYIANRLPGFSVDRNV